jgi:hypothetical protein
VRLIPAEFFFPQPAEDLYRLYFSFRSLRKTYTGCFFFPGGMGGMGGMGNFFNLQVFGNPEISCNFGLFFL